MPAPRTQWANERLGAVFDELHLTPQPARLFLLLHDQIGEWVPRELIVKRLFRGYVSGGGVNALIFRTRRQLEGSGWRIEAHYKNYRLLEPDEHARRNQETTERLARQLRERGAA